MNRRTLSKIANAWPAPPDPCTCFLKHRNLYGLIEVIDPTCTHHGDTP